jgi:hypothetical protein
MDPAGQRAEMGWGGPSGVGGSWRLGKERAVNFHHELVWREVCILLQKINTPIKSNKGFFTF